MTNKQIGIKIHQIRISDKHLDSFWYDDGPIAETKDFELVCGGIIDIRHETRQFRCNGFSTWDEETELENTLLDLTKSDDKTLASLTDLGYIWENNNWFEIIDRRDDAIGDSLWTGDNYDEAIIALEHLQREGIDKT